MLQQQKLGAFVWSKMGPESREDPKAILRRKEVERQANGGKFVWRIGKPVPEYFMGDAKDPMAVFTQTKNGKDPAKSGKIVVWWKYKDRQGEEQPLPNYSFVTGPAEGPFALLCECCESLLEQQKRCRKLRPNEWVHYKTGNPVAEQNSTTPVKKGKGRGNPRDIVFAASLYDEGWVELADCALIKQRDIDDARSAATEGVEEWKAFIDKIKGG